MRKTTLLLVLLLIASTMMMAYASAEDYKPHKINTTLYFSFADEDAIACNVTSIDTPNETLWINKEMDVSGDTFSTTIDAGNFSSLGVYCINLDCEDGYGDICREVTTNGEIAQTSKMGLSIFLIGILLIFFVVDLICLIKAEGYKTKFILYWVDHLLIIAITFITWQTANNYLTMDGGIAGIFKIMFYFFMISAFPMVLLSIVWMFYIHTFNEHFEKLLNKGEDVETAFRLTQKKRGGWFYGK